MPSNKTFFITGAGRGMGVSFAQAALTAGHNVVATGRNTDTITEALGAHENLLVAKLDITDQGEAEQAVQASLERFSRIDVLINNAANFFAGFFEELSPAQVANQLQTNLTGPMTVTRAVLPVMRKQRSGHVITISSLAGLIGMEFCSAYSAAKFGVEGWMEAIGPEVAPFGINTTVIEPGFFRTDLLTPESTTYAELSISDYQQRTKETRAAWQGMNGQQPGDPAKLAEALLTLTELNEPPRRWVAGADAVAAAEQKANEILAQIDAYRELSTDLAHTAAHAAA
jgi:NAD(P)-dependent dehydrogenase (short-subunit alcohol dehydrogenase family)